MPGWAISAGAASISAGSNKAWAVATPLPRFAGTPLKGRVIRRFRAFVSNMVGMV